MVTMITEKIATAHVSIKTNLRQETHGAHRAHRAHGAQPHHQDHAEINIKCISKVRTYTLPVQNDIIPASITHIEAHQAPGRKLEK